MDYAGASLRQRDDKLKMNKMRRNMFGLRKQVPVSRSNFIIVRTTVPTAEFCVARLQVH